MTSWRRQADRRRQKIQSKKRQKIEDGEIQKATEREKRSRALEKSAYEREQDEPEKDRSNRQICTE